MEVDENRDVVYEFGKFVLNPRERALFVDGVAVHLPAKEFDTLLLLVEHNGRALTKGEMLSAIWHDAHVEESNLAKQISRLRKLFSRNGEQFIETLPKHGYRFSAELRRTLVESEGAVILEKRTVKRVTLALDEGTEPELALPPARRSWLTLPKLALVLLVVGILGVTYLVWNRGRTNLPSTSAAIDPYAPVRLTDSAYDDTGPRWTRDGRIRFVRIYPDNRTEWLIMNADGTNQSETRIADGRTILSWSPDDQKILYQKHGDTSKTYLSNSDGSGETLVPFRAGNWSADSKMIVHYQLVAQNNYDIFVYFVETRKSRNITNSEYFEADPSFSPDGNKVVFSSSRDGNQEIYLMNLDGSDLRRLTLDPAIDTHPAFSPDGTQILFTSNRENDNADVYVMNADGTRLMKVTTWDKTNETAGPGAWSPDGTKIAFFSDRNGKDDIYVVSAETVRPKPVLTNSQNNLRSPTYSPDGKKLVYIQELEDKTGELRILEFDTQQSRLVKKTEVFLTTTDWSPDANWIAFSDRVNGDMELLLIKPDGTELRNLTNHMGIDASGFWSPDGKRLVFISGRGEPPGLLQLYIMNGDGTDQRPITPRRAIESDASWWPDGSSIIFTCDRGDSPGNTLDICQINSDGTGEKRLLFHRGHDSQPAISPDGKLIAFTARANGNHEIYLMNSDGSGLMRLTRNLADDESPRWSPDGKKIVFASNRNGKFGIYEIGL